MYSINPQHDFLVGIDSDGCAFDTMELKHKECFIPQFIHHYHLAGVSKYAREAAEFVNLYSKSRGVNRFFALLEQLELTRDRAEVRDRGYDVQIPAGVKAWTERETKLGNPTLTAEVEKTGDEDLKQALAWSLEVNETIARMVRAVPPFPYVRQSLAKLTGKADLLVVSATPNQALRAEWAEHDLDGMVVEICGQETGSKKETLTNASKYPANHTLMIGDAPGDYKAATANDALFFPINPGAEQESWRRLHEEGIDRFLNEKFAGDYQKKLLDEFDTYLPERPPWE